MNKDMDKVIGKTSSTRNQTNTSDEFSLWLEGNEKVNPTDIVVAQNADEEKSKTYGLVTSIENMSDSESHLDNFVSHDFGDAGIEPRTQRLSTNVARCAVLKNTENIYMPVVGGQNVKFSDRDGILTALGVGEVQKVDSNFRELPAGIIELSNGLKAPAIIDARYLLGPEGAHFNISGISGLAAKTSYAMFLLNVLLQKCADDVAVVIFNVKHDDLLYIDQPVSQSLPEDEQKLWDEVLGIEPKPFQDVKYFLPRGITGRPPKVRSNTYAETAIDHSRYSYDLKSISDKLSYLFVDVEDSRDTLRSLVEDIMEDLQKDTPTIKKGNHSDNVQTFTDLIEIFRKSGKYREHHYGTIGRFVKLMRYFTSTGTSGLFVKNKAQKEVNLAQHIWTIQPNQVSVIDIAKLRDFERAFVVGDVVNEVNKLFGREITYSQVPQDIRPKEWPQDIDLDSPIKPPKNVIFFVDELNKYAPSGRAESPILRNLLEITERGRSLGVILLGVEQFASDIHSRVIGNCSNKVYGRSDSTELSDQAYRHIPQDLKSLITRLDQGKLLLQHPLYRQPVQIRFPKPVYKQPGHKPEMEDDVNGTSTESNSK